MRIHEAMFDEFFRNRIPREGFTIAEVYEEYFGLIDTPPANQRELNGYTETRIDTSSRVVENQDTESGDNQS